MNNPATTLDAQTWQSVHANKHVQRLAAKAERIFNETSKRKRGLFLEMLKLWEQSTPLSEYFPEGTDLSTPEAIYRLEYSNRMYGAGWGDETRPASVARDRTARIAWMILSRKPLRYIRAFMDGAINKELGDNPTSYHARAALQSHRAQESPKVIDLSLWRQSHPRP